LNAAALSVDITLEPADNDTLVDGLGGRGDQLVRLEEPPPKAGSGKRFADLDIGIFRAEIGVLHETVFFPLPFPKSLVVKVKRRSQGAPGVAGRRLYPDILKRRLIL